MCNTFYIQDLYVTQDKLHLKIASPIISSECAKDTHL